MPQGTLMVMRVEDGVKSECRTVMVRISEPSQDYHDQFTCTTSGFAEALHAVALRNSVLFHEQGESFHGLAIFFSIRCFATGDPA